MSVLRDELLRINAGLARECHAAKIPPEDRRWLSEIAGNVVEAHLILQGVLLGKIKLAASGKVEEQIAQFLEWAEKEVERWKVLTERICLGPGWPDITEQQFLECSTAFAATSESPGVPVFGVRFPSFTEAVCYMPEFQFGQVVSKDENGDVFTAGMCCVSGWPDFKIIVDYYEDWLSRYPGWLDQPGEFARLALELEKIEKPKAEERQKATLKQGASPLGQIATTELGKTRDKIAEAVEVPPPEAPRKRRRQGRSRKPDEQIQAEAQSKRLQLKKLPRTYVAWAEELGCDPRRVKHLPQWKDMIENDEKIARGRAVRGRGYDKSSLESIPGPTEGLSDELQRLLRDQEEDGQYGN